MFPYSLNAYHTVTDNDFISRVISNNNIHFLWDVAHSKITAFNRNTDHEHYVISLPLDRCLQVHLSRYAKRGNVPYDAHECMSDKDWTYFSQQLARLPNLRYATLEYYKDGVILQRQLQRLRSILEVHRDRNRHENGPGECRRFLRS